MRGRGNRGGIALQPRTFCAAYPGGSRVLTHSKIPWDTCLFIHRGKRTCKSLSLWDFCTTGGLTWKAPKIQMSSFIINARSVPSTSQIRLQIWAMQSNICPNTYLVRVFKAEIKTFCHFFKERRQYLTCSGNANSHWRWKKRCVFCSNMSMFNN